MSNIELIEGSSIEQKVDAIVNAANKYLLSGGGVCGAIFKNAGYQELGDACKKIKTPLNDGDAVITPAFNIKTCKYIIHAVGPDFGVNPTAFDKLFNAYYNSLKVLKENNLHSISFPLISSGIFGGSLSNPVGESTRECVRAYKRFTEENPGYEIYVRLCAYSEKEYMAAEKEFII
jgi:O-acetyl-ADP-ribose deacetylase (regulator of RNase III)